MPVRDTSELLYPAVVKTIADLGLLGQDHAAAKLAQQYARTIDQAHNNGVRAHFAAVRWLGPELLKTLAELGATPAARAAIARGTKGPGKDPDKPKSQLDAMREARAKRA